MGQPERIEAANRGGGRWARSGRGLAPRAIGVVGWVARSVFFASLAFLALLAPGGAATAGEFQSGFGFGISVPDVWLVLTRGEVERNQALFLADDGVAGLEQLPTAIRRNVFDRIRQGELEVFYRRENEAEDFVDNVNFLLQPAELPVSQAELDGVCHALPGEFSRVFGRPIAMEACEMRDRVRGQALYLQFEGAVPGTTTMQYQLPRGQSSTLVITATTSRTSLPRMLSELEDMVESIRIY